MSALTLAPDAGAMRDASPTIADVPRLVVGNGDRVVTPSPIRRTCVSLVRFTPDEFRVVCEAARMRGMPVARHLREAALGVHSKSRREVPFAPMTGALIRCVARTGNVLKELAADARAQDRVEDAARLDTAVTELLDIVRRAE